jgi:hypothetical protein
MPRLTRLGEAIRQRVAFSLGYVRMVRHPLCELCMTTDGLAFGATFIVVEVRKEMVPGGMEKGCHQGVKKSSPFFLSE